MSKRVIALLLVVLCSLSVLALTSCKDEDEQSQAATSDSDEHFLNDAVDFGGTTVNILTHNLHDYAVSEIAPEKLNGEPVNDAFYNRNEFIKQTYGINITGTFIDNQANAVDEIRTDIQSSLGNYQAACIGITYIATLGVEGLLEDISAIENGYIHYDQPWWDQAAVRDLSLNGHVYFLMGDAIVEDDTSTWAIFFNKDLVKTNGLDDPYQLVRDNAWDLEAMHEMAKKVHHMHGSQMSYDPKVGDQWGMVAQSYDFYKFMLGCGQKMVDVSGDKPVLRVAQQENIQVFSDVFDLILDEENVGVADFFGRWDSGVYQQRIEIFCNGNALFMPGSIQTVFEPEFREAEIHYGILPMPMRNGGFQENYSSSVTVYWCNALVIPTNNNELDATCYALEAMAYYGKKDVTPEFYDRTLTFKRFQDDDSRDMLDLIFRNRTYDLADVFDFSNGQDSGSLYFYTDLLGQKSSDIMSHYEKKESCYQTGLQRLIDKCW